jgi:TPR repeat protein
LPVLVSTGGGWKSIAELEKTAAAGNARACYDLALLALEGSDPAVKKDAARAVALYEVAGRGGMADAWFRIGKVYHDGIGVAVDRAKSFGYYLKAARAGLPEAQYNVGAMLVSGRGVKRDLVEGLAWLIVAGKSGAPTEAEAQVRERLKRRPADIAAAQARAELLLKDPFAETAGADLMPSQPSAAETPKVGPAPIVVPHSKIAPPKVELAAPKIDLPTAPIRPPRGS